MSPARGGGRAGAVLGLWASTLLVSCRVEAVAPSDAGALDCLAPQGEVWVYTSLYRPVLEALEPVLRRELPSLTVRWYQAGSEKVASRLEAELAADSPQADLLLTSDPFLYERLAAQGHFQPFVAPRSLRAPRTLFDPEGRFAAARLSTMVIAHRRGAAAPESFRALSESRFGNQVVIGDPLTSGTALTWAAFMRARYGPAYFEQLARNRARAVGGNAAVLQKLEGREATVGVVLLENVLAAQAQGSAIEFLYPADGAVVIPGQVALLTRSQNPTAARAVFELLFADDVQRIFVEFGKMHGVDPALEGPGAQPGLTELLRRAAPWSDEVARVDRALLKREFRQSFGL